MPTTLLATQVPPPMVPTGHKKLSDAYLQTPPAGITLGSRTFTQGEKGEIASKLNENALRTDLAGRYGGGAYMVGTGLVLSTGSGLNAGVTAGQAIIDAIVEVPANTTVTIPASSPRFFVWLLQDKTFLVKNNDLSLPSQPAVLIGSGVSGASSITSVDESGVFYDRNGFPERTTADTGMPTDTPPATSRFYSKTLGGTYFWDGAKYFRIPDTATYLNPILAAQSVIVPSGTESMYYDDLTIDGSLTIDGRLVGILGMNFTQNTLKPSSGSPGALTLGRLAKSVAGGTDVTLTQTEYANGSLEFTGAITANINVIFPLTVGAQWTIYNNTTGAFTLTCKGATGTGIVIASTKRAIVESDGTNFVRITADV